MSNERDTTLDVQGMTCPSCVRHVSEALEELAGVTAVEVRLEEGTVVVRHDPEAASGDRLIGALRASGYESSPRARR